MSARPRTQLYLSDVLPVKPTATYRKPTCGGIVPVQSPTTAVLLLRCCAAVALVRVARCLLLLLPHSLVLVLFYRNRGVRTYVWYAMPIWIVCAGSPRVHLVPLSSTTWYVYTWYHTHDECEQNVMLNQICLSTLVGSPSSPAASLIPPSAQAAIQIHSMDG